MTRTIQRSLGLIRTSCTSVILLCGVPQLSAQLVQIPDVQLRAKMNAAVPGCVDAGGNLNTQHPGVLGLSEWFLTITWDPSTITGLEYFTGLDKLTISYNGAPDSSSIAAFPPGLHWLRMSVYPGTSLPPFPMGLDTLTLNGLSNLQTLPLLPDGIIQLNLTGLDQVSNPIHIPYAVEDLRLLQMYALPAIDSLPAGLKEFRIHGPQLDTMPLLPPHMEWLAMTNLPQLVHLPNLPDTVDLTCSLNLLTQLTELPQSPDTVNSFDLYDLWSIDSLPPFPKAEYLSLNAMPLVQTIPELPGWLYRIQLTDMSGLHCLPWLPESLQLFSLDEPDTPVNCIPNMPPDLAGLWFMPPVCDLFSAGNCPTHFATVAGTVYHDVNADGTRDPGEEGLPYAAVNLAPGGVLTGVWLDGFYHTAVDTGSYTLTAIPFNPYVTGVAPLAHTAAITSPFDVDTLNDFGLVLVPDVEDLMVGVVSGVARPGFDNQAWMAWANVGTVPIASGSATLVVDGDQTVVSATPPADVVNGDTLTWTYSSLGIGQGTLVTLTLHTDTSVPLGTDIVHAATVNPLLNDTTPANNTYIDSTVVQGSYDPNDKHVMPLTATTASVMAGLPLTWTVRFQNTGTYPAEHVRIVDLLSADLDPATFRFVSSSHPCIWSLVGDTLVFDFPQIGLPDSTSDEAGSHGYVQFTVEPDIGLANGTVVPNNVSIFFDFNAPVITDDAEFQVSDPSSVRPLSRRPVWFGPNPVEDVLSIPDLPVGYVVEVLDASGQVVQRMRSSGGITRLSVQHLAPGAYALRVQGSATQAAAPFIKQ